MSTNFSSLPVVDVGALRDPNAPPEDTAQLSQTLHNVFATTGFAYLTNVPLSFDHEEIFELSRDFFALPLDQKMKLAKKSFRPINTNTYRGCVRKIFTECMVLTVSVIFLLSRTLLQTISKRVWNPQYSRSCMHPYENSD